MTEQERTATQLSPDGRWRWDGTRWLPVEPQPSGTASRPRLSRTAVVALALVGSLVVGAVAGSIAGGLTGARPRPPAAFPSAFPSGGDRYLAGQTVSGLEHHATSSNYTCNQQQQGPSSQFKQSITCDFNGNIPTSPTVLVFADGDSQVGEVIANCTRPFGATKSACGSFDGSVVRLLFPQGSPLGSQAQAWAAQNVGNGRATIIGSVYLFAPAVNADQVDVDCLPAGGARG